MEEENMGAKCLLQKMIITPWLGLGRIRELEGMCIPMRGEFKHTCWVIYHTCLFGSNPLFLGREDYNHPSIKLTYKPFCHCIEEKQSSKYTGNFFLRLRLLFRRLVEGVVFFESSHP